MFKTYAERRAAALRLAAAYEGWGLPPRPEGNPHIWSPRYMPHKQCLRIFGSFHTPAPDKYGYVTVPDSIRMRAYFEAKEKAQNREKISPFL